MLTANQIAERRRGIGGSEICAILGLSRFSGPVDVYLAKAEGFQQATNPDMERGSFLESGVADWAASRMGVNLSSHLTVHHPSAPALCTPDRTWIDDAGLHLLSIKCPRFGGDAWGFDGTSLIPEAYAIQLQWEDMVCRDAGWKLSRHHKLAALIDGDLRIYNLERDEELQEYLLKFCRDWWAKHVETNTPPPLDGSPGASAWILRRFPRDTRPLRGATESDNKLMGALRAADAGLKIAEAEWATAAQRMKEAIGDDAGIEGDGFKVTWKANVKGSRVFKPTWRQYE